MLRCIVVEMIQTRDSSPFEILHHDLERVCRNHGGRITLEAP